MANDVESVFPDKRKAIVYQYLRQLRKAEGGVSGMNATQAGDLVENLGQ